MWFHLFTQDTGGVRVPTLKNHYKANNDILRVL